MDALRLVFRDARYMALGIGAAFALAVLYLWESQVLIIGSHGISWFVEPAFIAAALLLALLFGLLLPLHIYAFKLAAASAGQTGGTVLGVVLGTASMTCCAPVLLPSLLSLLGFSGTAILGVNGFLHRFWVPLATIGVVFLSYSLYSAIDALNLECRIRTLDRELKPEPADTTKPVA
jgi:hypothetical protein